MRRESASEKELLTMKMKNENGMITESFDYDCTALLALEQYLELKSNEGLMLLGVRGGSIRHRCSQW